LDNLHSMQADADVKARLFRILQQILDRTMRRQRFRSLTRTMPSHQADARSREPGQEQVGPCRDLLRRLECLPERQRSAVLLISVENLTYTEAAAILGISATDVMQQLASGREQLRQTDVGLSPDMETVS
jgi:RNA polymerase sigma-70 factor (ECF subfamily)